MKSGIIDSTFSYSITTPIFEGPLDLLLHLIENAELDITRLALAEVTDQYIKYIHHLEEERSSEIKADQVSAFLIIAAKLLQIKSEVLLPKPPDIEPDQEDIGEGLARQLRAYKRYKEISNLLMERQNRKLKTYLRMASPPNVKTIIHIDNYNIEDIYSFAERVFNYQENRLPLGDVVTAPKVTIREKISTIVRYVKMNKRGVFKSLFSKDSNRIDVVVTFLALLELIKRHLIFTRQEELFGDIYIDAVDGLENGLDFEVEFGE